MADQASGQGGAPVDDAGGRDPLQQGARPGGDHITGDTRETDPYNPAVSGSEGERTDSTEPPGTEPTRG